MSPYLPLYADTAVSSKATLASPYCSNGPRTLSPLTTYQLMLDFILSSTTTRRGAGTSGPCAVLAKYLRRQPPCVLQPLAELWYTGTMPKQQEHRRTWLEAYKESSPCVYCGGFFPAAAMDLDHRPGEKKLAAVSTLVSSTRSMRVVKAEVAKCDLVCANCHRVRTATRRAEAKAAQRASRSRPPSTSASTSADEA